MTTIVELHSSPVFKKDQPDDNFKFLPLPEPSGSYPYRLSLGKIKTELNHKKMVFHLVGDTGGVKNPDFQRLIAMEMGKQYEEAEIKADEPQFLYHLGDIVYHHGEAEHYYTQFFKPYQHYPGPIFAIAGNHDSDVNLNNTSAYKSLDAFKKVFCDTIQQPVSFSGDANRKSMVQPNIYWTLQTPLANIIGLHSNVPKFGVITEEQKAWFIEELKAAQQERADKALIVCVHHAPYSADINHGSSIPMIRFLENAFKESGVKPDIVFSGHVHNYQRFSKQYEDGKTVPFIVSGAGGFDELHSLAAVDDERFTAESPLFKQVQLENYCEHKHGFLKISLERTTAGITLTGEYYTLPHERYTTDEITAALTDRFLLNIAAGKTTIES